jgi:hypothetical protein
MKMQSFHFDEIYATRRRKHLSFLDAQCPKILKIINIKIRKKGEKGIEHQCTMDDQATLFSINKILIKA